MAEVGLVAGVVALAGGAQVVARPPVGGVEVADVAGIRARGADEVDQSAGVGAEEVGELGGIPLADLDQSAGVGAEHVLRVGPGELRPAGLELDPDRAASGEGGLDEGGAGAGHRVGHELPGAGALGDDAPGEVGEHLAGVGRAGGQVAAGPLVLGALLADRPDGERHRTGLVPAGGLRSGGGAGGGGRGHGRPTAGEGVPPPK